MQPKAPPDTRPQPDLFRSRLDNMLNRQHPLYRLADKIDWGFFEKEFGPLYVEKVGRPGLQIRLLVGLPFLKHAFGESDESVVERFGAMPGEGADLGGYASKMTERYAHLAPASFKESTKLLDSLVDTAAEISSGVVNAVGDEAGIIISLQEATVQPINIPKDVR